MHKLSLPVLKMDLPQWSTKELQLWDDKTEALREKGAPENVGVSNGIKERAWKIAQRVALGADLSQEIQRGKDIRALIWLWLEDVSAYKSKFMQPAEWIFRRFENICPKMSKLALYDLTLFYLQYYDEIHGFDALCHYIKRQYQRQKLSGHDSDMSKIQYFREMIFSNSGPRFLAKEAEETGKPLDRIYSEIGIPVGRSGRFYQACTNLYYLCRLEQLGVGDNSPLFAELVQDKVANSAFRDGLFIGHAVINILVGKAMKASVGMPENWLKVILTIAGDPRVPTSASSYQTWWSMIDVSYISAVRGWLSRFDLGLFLKAIDAFAIRSGKEDLQRMYPARKKFLEGLDDLGVIKNSRLFVGRSANHFLLENYEKKELPFYANLADKDKCIIYMQVGDYHIIEGSHSSYLWIYDRLPFQQNIHNPNIDTFDVRELGVGLKEVYDREFESNSFELSTENPLFPFRIQHNPNNLSWQRSALKALHSCGLDIDAEAVLSEADYQILRHLYGLNPSEY